MDFTQDLKSILCIIGGALLVLSASDILFKLLLVIIGCILIAYGILLRKTRHPATPFVFIVREWFFRR